MEEKEMIVEAFLAEAEVLLENIKEEDRQAVLSILKAYAEEE